MVWLDFINVVSVISLCEGFQNKLLDVLRTRSRNLAFRFAVRNAVYSAISGTRVGYRPVKFIIDQAFSQEKKKEQDSVTTIEPIA